MMIDILYCNVMAIILLNKMVNFIGNLVEEKLKIVVLYD